MDNVNITKRVVSIPGAHIRYSELGENSIYFAWTYNEETNAIDLQGACTQSELTAQFSAMSKGRIIYFASLIDMLKGIAEAVEVDSEQEGE